MDIIYIILTTLAILVPIILWKYPYDDFKKIMQKLRIEIAKYIASTSRKTISRSLAIGKYAFFFLIVGAFIYILIIRAHKVEFTPQIYTSIGHVFLSFIIVIPIISAIEPLLLAFFFSIVTK